MTQFPDCELGESPVRFGVVPYTNKLPLLHFLPELLPSSTMIQYLPSQLLFRLVSHHIDVALMPVASLMDLPSGVILGDSCISCRGKVESVLIVSRKPIDAIHSISLDVSSRSSVMLTEVIFREFYNADPDKFQLQTNVNPYESKTDAFLIIGDPALKLKAHDGWQYRYDVGEIWQQHTSLPFVFAAWITCRNKHYNVHPFATILSNVRDKGINAIPEIVSEHKEELPISPEKAEAYLTNSVHYKIEQEERTALKKFFDLAKTHKIIPTRNKITFSDGTEI